MYKVYVSDGESELTMTFSDLHKAVVKVEDFVKRFPEYMVSIRKVNEADWD